MYNATYHSQHAASDEVGKTNRSIVTAKKAGYTKGESVVGESPTLVATANGAAKRRYKVWGSSKHREQFLVHACYYHEKSNSEEAGGSSSVELTMF